MRVPRWNVKYTVLSSCSLIWLFNQLNRNIVPPALPVLMIEFNLTKIQSGLLMTVLFITYAGMQFPAGILSDKFGRKTLITLGAIFYSVTTFLTGLSKGFNDFVIYRAATGVADGTNYAPSMSLISEFFPQRKLGKVTAIYMLMPSLSMIIAPIMAAFFIEAVGWRWLFYVCAIPSLIMAAVFWVSVSEPDQTALTKVRMSLTEVLSFPLIILSVLQTLTLMTLFGINTFFMVYLVSRYNVVIAVAGSYFAILSLVTLVSTLLGGLICDKVSARIVIITNTGLLAVLFVLLTALVSSIPQPFLPFIITLAIIFFVQGVTLPASLKYIANITDLSLRGSAYGLANTFGFIGSAIAPALVGYIYDVASFETTFIFFAIIAGISFMLAFTLPKTS